MVACADMGRPAAADADPGAGPPPGVTEIEAPEPKEISGAAAVPVGVGCRMCERMDCRQRAFPPLQDRLNVDVNVRGLSAYVSTEPGG